MKKELLLLINPKAGRGAVKNSLLPVVDIFTKAGYVVTVCPTQQAGEVESILAELSKGKELIVSCGGDGTLNETINAMMHLNISIPFGYIPAGTVNDFAASMHLSKNMAKAAMAIVEGSPFAFDTGEMNGRYFAYVAAFGAFADVSYSTPQQSKNIFGRAAYFLEGISRLGKMTGYHLTVEYSGGTIEDEFLFGMVTNSVSIGGFQISKQAKIALNDGLFEVCLIKRPKNPLDLQSIINALLWQKPDPAHMYVFKTSNLTICSQEELDWTLDGEFGGTTLRAELANRKESLQILVNKQPSAQKEKTLPIPAVNGVSNKVTQIE